MSYYEASTDENFEILISCEVDPPDRSAGFLGSTHIEAELVVFVNGKEILVEMPEEWVEANKDRLIDIVREENDPGEPDYDHEDKLDD